MNYDIWHVGGKLLDSLGHYWYPMWPQDIRTERYLRLGAIHFGSELRLFCACASYRAHLQHWYSFSALPELIFHAI